MLAWATGHLSHANYYRSLGAEHIGPAEKAATEAALTMADAAEVESWSAVYTALLYENVMIEEYGPTPDDSSELMDKARRARLRLEELQSGAEHKRRQALERGHVAGSGRYEVALTQRKTFEDALSILKPVFDALGLEE
jgi:hypothetical protein